MITTTMLRDPILFLLRRGLWVVAFLSSTVWASETEGESPSDGIIGSRTSSLSSLSPVSEAAVSRFLGRSDELVDQARLIFDLGDITINFIPLIVFAKLILLALWLLGFLGEEEDIYTSGYGHASSGSHSSSSSGYGAPSTGYSSPSTGYAAPAPSYSAPSTGYSAGGGGGFGYSATSFESTHYQAPSSGYSVHDPSHLGGHGHGHSRVGAEGIVQGRLEGQQYYQYSGGEQAGDAAEVGGGGLWETAGSVVSGMADAAINLGSLLGSTFFGGSDGTITEQGEHIRFHDLDGNDITNKVVFVDDPNNRRSDDPAHHYRTSDRRSSTARYDNGLGDYSYGYDDGDTGNYGYDEDSSSDYGIPQQQPPPPPQQQPPPPRGVYGQTFNWDGLGQGQEGGKDEGQWAWKKAEQDLTGGTIASGSGGGIQYYATQNATGPDDYYSYTSGSGSGPFGGGGPAAGESEGTANGLEEDFGDDIIRPSTRVDSIQDILASRRRTLDSILSSKNGVIGQLLSARRKLSEGGGGEGKEGLGGGVPSVDPSQPATIQKILRETHEEMLPRQTVTLDDILKSSRNRAVQEIERPPEEAPASGYHHEAPAAAAPPHPPLYEEDPRPKMDLDKQPRLVDGGGGGGGGGRVVEGGFVPLHITPL